MAKAKKSKGFLAAAGSLLGSIPAVGSVKNAAKKVKQATKKTVQKVKKVAKVAKKTVKKTVKKKKKQLAASLKKAAKKAKKKAKKKIGKVLTKARKLKNNLSPKQQIKKLKKNMKKAVLAGKKVGKKIKAIAKLSKKAVVIAKKNMKKSVLTEKYCTADSPRPNYIKKSWYSFLEIGDDFLAGINTRNENKFDSFYDFTNYLTAGISGGIISGAKSRASKLSDSPADFANYMTLGATEMIKGAFAPEELFSKEHWQNSFGVATMVAGGTIVRGGKGSVGTSSTKKTGNSNEASKPPEGNAGVKGVSETNAIETSSETVKYYRVQGGNGTNSSFERVAVNEDGTLSIATKKSSLNVSAETMEHAKYFKEGRGNGAYIIEFEVDTWFHELVTENAIKQAGYKTNLQNQGRTAPKIVDPKQPGLSMELPPIWNDWLEEYAKNAKLIKEETGK